MNASEILRQICLGEISPEWVGDRNPRIGTSPCIWTFAEMPGYKISRATVPTIAGTRETIWVASDTEDADRDSCTCPEGLTWEDCFLAPDYEEAE